MKFLCKQHGYIVGECLGAPVTQEKVTFISSGRFVNRPYEFVRTTRLYRRGGYYPPVLPSHPPSRELSLRASREIFVQTTRLHCRGRRPRRPVTQENDTLKPNNPSPIYDGSSLYTREPFFVRTTRQHRRGVPWCSRYKEEVTFTSNGTPRTSSPTMFERTQSVAIM